MGFFPVLVWCDTRFLSFSFSVLFYYYCFDCLRPVYCAHNVACVSGFRILLTFTYKFYNVLLYVIYNKGAVVVMNLW